MRLIKALPELMILIRGMAAAARSVTLVMVLLSFIIFVFAVAFRQLTDGTPLGSDLFPTVPKTIATLLLQGLLPDQAGVVQDVAEYNLVYAFAVLLFILLAALTVMNMLIGVL